MSKKRTWSIAALATVMSLSGLVARAQEGQEKRTRVEVQSSDVVVTRTRTPQDPAVAPEVFVEGIPGQGDTFVFVSSEMSIDGKVVKGAPYSAQAVTEMIQMLADGNRITRKNTANVFRDSEGRTRRDQMIGTIGPFAVNGDPAQTIFINDPVAGVHYILDPRSRTARKLPRFDFRFEFGGKEAEGVRMRGPGIKELEKLKVHPDKDGETHGFVFTTPGPPPPGSGPHGMGPVVAGPGIQFFGHSSKVDAKTEKLEKQLVEGVMAEGTRTTVTIPAGDIGNEQPIVIVSERWYSPELQMVIMTRHSDPRFGENTYKLTNINRTEPAATLFQVPGDYTLKAPPSFPRRLREKKPGDLQ